MFERTTMVNVFSGSKKKDENTEGVTPTVKQDASPATLEQPAALFQKLKIEEAQLLEEKQNLTHLKEQLQKKIKDQIDTSKNNLQKLKTEVSELKIQCAQLNETLENEIIVE
jgi:predicted transcriptional regulator